MFHIFKEPQVTDTTYDAMKLQYRRMTLDNPVEAAYLTKARSIAEQVGAFGFTTRHDFPVLDTREIYDITRLKSWLDMVDSKTPILITPSYTGISLELIYLGGQLHKAINKGDGIVGLDVTAQAYLINGIPQQINENERVSIRGTVTIPYKGKDDGSVVRDISRALMTYNSADEEIRAFQDHLMFIPTEVNIPGTTFDTKELRSILLAWDFYIPIEHSFPANRKETGYLEEIVEDFYSKIGADDVYIDGLIFTVVNTQRKLELGYTSRFPEWTIKLVKKVMT